jgi:hypothetical protein
LVKDAAVTLCCTGWESESHLLYPFIIFYILWFLGFTCCESRVMNSVLNSWS